MLFRSDSVRKLYFRGTSLIDAGGRFASDTVPEYLEYDMPSLDFAKLFIKTIEDGLKDSAIDVPKSDTPKSKPKAESKPEPESTPEKEEVIDLDDFEDINPETKADEVDKDALMAEIRAKFKDADKETKTKVRNLLKESGFTKLDDSLSVSELQTLDSILSA